jgi:RHS repeat-associated protein
VSVDALTSVVSSSTFMPFGSLRSGGPVGTERTFTGQVDDAGTGLMFYNARYYDPVVGRFTQADTVLDGTNRYTYVRNNPTRFADPTGRSEVVFHPDGGSTCIFNTSEGPIILHQTPEVGERNPFRKPQSEYFLEQTRLDLPTGIAEGEAAGTLFFYDWPENPYPEYYDRRGISDVLADIPEREPEPSPPLAYEYGVCFGGTFAIVFGAHGDICFFSDADSGGLDISVSAQGAMGLGASAGGEAVTRTETDQGVSLITCLEGAGYVASASGCATLSSTGEDGFSVGSGKGPGLGGFATAWIELNFDGMQPWPW